jgi:NTP pyrophosphatase (non-canonical NTP hydrolase)
MMDATTTVAALRSRCRAFCEARAWQQFHTPKDLALAMSIEVGEILELFRFKKEETIAAELKQEDHRERLGDEMADVLYFLLQLADHTGVELASALERKLLKNEQKYPVDLAYGRNVKYTELQVPEAGSPRDGHAGAAEPLEGVGTDDPALDSRRKRSVDL